jgi:tRNA pseudouridine32 synthase / 23S rRNA pseudouridine746 synthase
MTESDHPLAGCADLLFEDRHLIVLNKFPGCTVIPGRNTAADSESLRERLERFTGDKVYVVHRIDRDTSGLILFCKDAESHRILSRQFEQRTVKKTYLALVQGTLSDTVTVNAPLRQFGSGRMGVAAGGKPSLTRITVESCFQGATLVTAIPETGRRHQIRVHLYHLGHPVMGDRLYGTERPVGGIERMMLHATSISCIHPDGTPFTRTAPLLPQWKKIISRFSIEDV